MSKAVPSKPNQQPVRRNYVVTTTSRVPGRIVIKPDGSADPAVDRADDVADGPEL
ncbi:hypothetical protein [Nocardioides sp. CER19]|uniref:hypothetical protein n=1 Tax=Nocardioides sp. CER19 TaxID=3038538 RepID=UPI00244C6948|nr:hypothetical protein [Nocardioides sp. CER19]MDH2413110.1 hypothetical protein [Nocardioides sp. CER19]